jgi:hypothetical protein
MLNSACFAAIFYTLKYKIKKYNSAHPLLSVFSIGSTGGQNVPAEKMNIIKTNVTAYAFRNINLSYERAFNRWFSVNIGLEPCGRKEFFINSFLKDKDEKRFENLKVKPPISHIEPRFYIGKGYGKGFYFAPYYRYSDVSSNTFDFYYDYNGLDGNTYIPLKGRETPREIVADLW